MSEGVFGGWQIRRVRLAYTSVGGPASGLPGYAGMLEEMLSGLRQLAPRERALADDRVLRAIFFGPVGVGLLRLVGRVAPSTTSRILAASSPWALGWLVGEIRWTGAHTNEVPSCRFRSAGGPALCAEVCRRPTERFCAEAGFPVSLRPDPDSQACHWTWLATRNDRS